MNLLKLLLYPIATLYNGLMRLRNYLYDIGHKPSFHFEIPVIVVGNLNMGGSGKTPMLEYLIRLLKDQYPIVTLSRGYKRETSGYRVATGTDTALSIGDEPLQLFRKFGHEIKVVVGEDRVYAIPHILHEFPETRVILLDDAFQQRPIKAALSILLTTYRRPFYSDFVLPFGRLREARQGASRADVVVITKCDESIDKDIASEMKARVHKYAPSKPVLFSNILYGEARPLSGNGDLSNHIVLVTGIANAKPLIEHCEKRFTILKHFRYPDHHRYSSNDLNDIEVCCRNQSVQFSILTTEKDMVKLQVPEFEPFIRRFDWFWLPIQMGFLQDGAKFDELVLETVQKPEAR